MVGKRREWKDKIREMMIMEGKVESEGNDHCLVLDCVLGQIHP